MWLVGLLEIIPHTAQYDLMVSVYLKWEEVLPEGLYVQAVSKTNLCMLIFNKVKIEPG